MNVKQKEKLKEMHKQKSLEGMVKKLQVKIQVIGEAITQIIEKRNKKYTTSLLYPWK